MRRSAERNVHWSSSFGLDNAAQNHLGERRRKWPQTARKKFRAEILGCKKNATRDGWRVCEEQKDLWETVCAAGRLFESQNSGTWRKESRATARRKATTKRAMTTAL